MSRGLNKVMLIGNLGRDPEMRFTPNGRPVTAFSMAVSRNWTTAEGERREETEWFNIVAWGELAERANKFMLKGQRVYVEGRLQTRSWESADGLKHSRTEVVAGELLMLDGKKSEEEGAQGDPAGDDIPF